MPRVSEFYGIAIYMYWSEHGVPHFHARYAGRRASVSIESGSIIDGDLPRRIRRLVRQWAGEHHDELNANWIRAREGKGLKPIAPLI